MMNMKTDLATSIVVAIVGILIAYFVTNFFTGEIEDFTYTTVDSSIGSDLDEPDPEVFNYKALNPTVEVYVGECDQFDADGECIDEETERDTQTQPESGSQETP